MPAVFRGFVVCDGCSKAAPATATFGAWGKFWWDLPEGWLLYEHGAHSTSVYCSYGCVKGYHTHPAQTGTHEEAAYTFDPRTMGKLAELADAPDSTADEILSAIQAVLTAWGRKEATDAA
jgi:hypothetical protein